MCVIPSLKLHIQAGNNLKELLSAFMSYIIIHSEMFSGNRVVQPIFSLSLSDFLSHSLIYFQFPIQEECAVIDDKSLQTALKNFPFMSRQLVFSPLHTPSWAKQGSSALLTAEPDNEIMINFGPHRHAIIISLWLRC